MRARTLVVAIALLLVGCATHVLPTPQASATPNCQKHGCPQAFPTPMAAHWLIEGDVGQSGTAANETPAQFKADVNISKDSGPNNLDISAFYCQGGGGVDSSSYSDSTINWSKIWAGTDCLSAHYNNIGMLNQRVTDQHGVDGSCGTTTQPYDSFYKFLENQQTLGNGALEAAFGKPQPAIFHEQGTAQAIGDRLFQPQSTNCTGTGQDGLPNPAYIINLASPFTMSWEDSYTQGLSTTYGTGAGNSYPWSGPCVDGTSITNTDGSTTSAGCLDNYGLILADRQVVNRNCIGVSNLNGVNGGFLEAPMASTGTFYDDNPLLDADRDTYYAQSKHRATSWNPNGLFLYQLNSGDCQDSVDPSYPTVNQTQSFLNTLPPNVVIINAEDTLFDTSTCGNWTSANQGAGTYAGPEVRRWSGRAAFTINSAFTLYGLHRGYVEETSCTQPFNIVVPSGAEPQNSPCNTGNTYSNSAEMLDLSLRYWVFGIAMATWNPQYGYARLEMFPSSGSNAVCAMPAYAEHQLVVADPDVIPGPYLWGTAPTGFCNGSSGGALNPGPGESGGLYQIAIPGSCRNSPGSSFFTKVPVVSRLYNECWIKSQYVGACGVIVNLGGNNDTTCNVCYVDTVQHAFTHVSGADTIPTGGFHHVMQITNPLDVEEGGAISITSTATITVALSNASDNTANRCTEGVDWDYTLNSGAGGFSAGKVSVCELSAIVVFR